MAEMDITKTYAQAVLRHSVKTNADSIRSYSDEKIAGAVCTGCPPGKDFGQECTGDGACYDCWLDWLKQEVEQDEP